MNDSVSHQLDRLERINKQLAAALADIAAARADASPLWDYEQHRAKLTKAEEKKLAAVRREYELAKMRETYEARGIAPLEEWDE